MLNPSQVAARAGSPQDAGEPVFTTPWEARIFAITAHLAENAAVEWDDFRDDLIMRIASGDAPEGDGTDYYRAWLAATEDLLARLGTCAPGELEARIHALAHPDAAGKLSPTGHTAAPVSEG
jgi:nitrile hydratase accessory protein